MFHGGRPCHKLHEDALNGALHFSHRIPKNPRDRRAFGGKNEDANKLIPLIHLKNKNKIVTCTLCIRRALFRVDSSAPSLSPES